MSVRVSLTLRKGSQKEFIHVEGEDYQTFLKKYLKDSGIPNEERMSVVNEAWRRLRDAFIPAGGKLKSPKPRAKTVKSCTESFKTKRCHPKGKECYQQMPGGRRICRRPSTEDYKHALEEIARLKMQLGQPKVKRETIKKEEKPMVPIYQPPPRPRVKIL